MKFLFKTLLWVVGISLLVVVAAAILIPVFVDPNDYRDEIAEAVRKETGRELRIPGSISLSVFPWLGVDLGTVELGNAPGFADPIFARTDKVQVGVKVLPLLTGQVEMSTVVVDGLSLNLARNAQGEANWDDLVRPEKETGEPTEPAEPSEPPPITALAIGGLDIRNAHVSWDDALTGQRYDVDQLTLETGALSLDKPVDLHVEFDLKGGDPSVAGHVSTDAKLNVDPNAERYQVSGLKVETALTGDALPGGRAVITLDANAEFDGKQQSLAISDLELNLPELALNDIAGNMALRANVTGDMAKQTYNVSAFDLSGKLAGQAVPGEELEFEAGANVAIDLEKQTAAISAFELNAADLKARGELAASELLSSARFTGKLELTPFSPRALLERLGQPAIETADSEVLATAGLKAGLSGSLDNVSLNPLTVTLDDTTLEGTVNVENIAAPAVRFSLNVNGIDADRYLPPPTEDDQPATASPGAVTTAGAQLPLDTLRALNAEGSLRIDNFKISNLNVSDIALNLKAKDGLIRLHPVSANLYEGTYAGNIGLDARGQQANITVDEKLTDIQAGPFLNDLQGEDRLTGRGNLSVQVSMSGATPDDFKKTLNGVTAFAFEDGAVKGINIGRLIRQARAALGGQPLPPEEGPVTTDFSELRGSVQFRNGLASNQDLQAKSPVLRVDGKGTANLVDESLDYLLTNTLVATGEGQGGKELQDLQGIPIPIRVTGTFSAPSYQVDPQALAQALLEGKVEEQKQKALDKVEKMLDKELGDKLSDEDTEAAKKLLKGLFN